MSGMRIIRGIQEGATATIAASGTDSTVIPLGQFNAGSVQLPSAITGEDLTFNYSHDKTNWTAVPALTDESNPATVAANGTYVIPAMAFRAPYLQLVMDEQAAARTITIFLRA